VRLDHVSDSVLSVTRDRNEIPQLLEPQVEPVGLKVQIRERMFDVGEVRGQVLERPPNRRKGEVVDSPQRTQDVQLDQIHE
jgi:hypothetical protein